MLQEIDRFALLNLFVFISIFHIIIFLGSNPQLLPYHNAPDLRAVHAHQAVPLPDDRAGQQERQAEGGVPGGVGQPH